MCLVEPAEDEEEEAKGGASSHLVLGRVSVDRCTRWSQLSSALGHTFTSYLRTVSGEREEAQRSPLGLGPGSISSILIGEDPGCCLDVLFDSKVKLTIGDVLAQLKYNRSGVSFTNSRETSVIVLKCQ